MSKPHYVYQYLKYDAFLKVMQGKTIRLSDIQCSNDTTELQLVFDIIRSVLKEVCFSMRKKCKYFRDCVSEEEFNAFLKNNTVYIDEIQNILQTQYVSCFSKEKDLLSMWRGYAEDYSDSTASRGGIAVGFDVEKLTQLAEQKNVSCEMRFGEVKYSIRRQKALFRKSAEKMMREIRNHVKEKKTIQGFDRARFQLWYHEQVIEQGPFIKHPFFSEEKEYRLVHWGSKSSAPFIGSVNGLKLSNTEWGEEYQKRIKENELLTKNGMDPKPIPAQYYTLYFDDDANAFIKEIVVGPKCAIKIEQIETILSDDGIICDVEASKGLNVYVDSINHKH